MKHHPLADCENCPLQYEDNYVPSKIPENPTVAIVGAQPTLGDTRNNRVFSGPNGKLVQTVLTNTGTNQAEVLFTNAVLCRGEIGEAPTDAALSACRPRLLGEINNSGVGKVLALGSEATKSILNDSAVTKLRIGRPKENNSLPGIMVIPTYHPAAVMREGSLLQYFVNDFTKLNLEIPNWIEPSYKVCETVEDALATMDAVDDLSPDALVVDIETDIEKDEGFNHPQMYQLLCVGFAYAKGKVIVLSEEVLKVKSVLDRLRRLFRKYRFVAHNSKFDLKGLYAKVGPLACYFDTMIASYVMNEYSGNHKPHSLEYIGMEYFGTPNWKHVLDPWQPKTKGYSNVPRDILYQYNAYDCAIEWDIMEEYIRQLDDKGLRKAHDFIVDKSNELVYVELSGITVDRTYLPALAEKFEGELGLLEIKMNLIVDENLDKNGGLNPRSPMQLKKAFSKLGANVGSTDEATCNYIIEQKPGTKLAEFSELLLEHRGISKDYGTYVKGIDKLLFRGRVYPNFLVHGTTNGRLSCRNPNLQNIPRKSFIRKLFVVSKPDNVFIQADYSQAELRILSWLSGDQYFRDIFNGGTRDIFDELSAELFPQYPKATTDKEFFKDLRVRVKAYVYGLAYGRTEYGLSRELKISVHEAVELKHKFFEIIPDIVKWQQWVRDEVANGNDLISPFGRHRRFYYLSNENTDKVMREALSFLPSSTSSDVCLRAMAQIRRETAGYAYVRNIVHDSILIECHESDANELQSLVQQRMLESGRELVGDYVKFAVDSKIGKTWGDV